MKITLNKGIIKPIQDLTWLCMEIPKNQLHLIDKLKKVIELDVFEAEFKKKREKRSLQSNAAMWKLLDMMSTKLKTSKDELYLEMLDRYGVFTHIAVFPEAVERIKQEWRTCRILGNKIIDGKNKVIIQVYYGSSQYNKEEFARLLDGIISEASEIDVFLITEEERNSYVNNWNE